MTQNTWYHMQITLSGSNIKVSWNGQLVVNWTDPSNPFLSGKVGFRQDNSYHTHWDNFVAWSTTSPTVVAYDDYYPFGQYMDARSYNAGFSDARYKYTEKERDGETGYDYFGARYYDARVGRWMSVDPLAEKYVSWSGYHYAANNPLLITDGNGKEWNVGGDMKTVQSDIKDLVGESNMQFVNISAGGTVTLAEGFKAQPGTGAGLVQALVGANEVYTYNVADKAQVESSNGPIQVDVNGPGSVGVFSAVKGGFQNDVGTCTSSPLKGDAELTIPAAVQYEKGGKSVPRTNIVFHELTEVKLMVDSKGNLPRYSEKGPSAHLEAGMYGVERAKKDKVDPNGADGVVDKRVK
jgi:RHS repeat-associated protein